MIPKIFHWIWVGPNPLPPKDLHWIKSWRDNHRNWDCIVWAEFPEKVRAHNDLAYVRTRALPPIINYNVYQNIEKWVTGRAALAAKADILRMEIIARYGGVYLDTDVQCLSNIDDLMENVRLFVSDEWGPCVGNYMFGAVPNHPALWTAVRELEGHLQGKGKISAVDATGPQYLNPKLRTHSDLVIFPHQLFNPLCAWDDHAQVKAYPSCSLGNHCYDGKWYDRTKRVPPADFRADPPNPHFTPVSTGGGS